MRDLHNLISAAIALNPAAITSNTTTNGTGVDLKGFESCDFAIASGTLTDGSYAVTVQESDDNSTFADAAAVDLLGSNPSFASTDDNVLKTVGYRGSKRYVRIKVVSTSVTTGGTVAAVAIRGRARHKGTQAA